MNEPQELAHGEGFDYNEGSPHLKHRPLNRDLLRLVRDEIRATAQRGLPPRVLDVGAGHGSFVEPLLAYGCTVVATEMSRPSIARLLELYGRNERFSALFDPTGRLDALPRAQFAVVLFASVLHHIPDYVGALSLACDKVAVGGSIVTIQDPLWYPTVPVATRWLAFAAYSWWRIGQRNFARGLQTRIRRMRGIYDETNPSDVVEYHVVRKGVNEGVVAALLAQHFEDVRLVRYWSTQSALWQALGRRLGRKNTFAVVARGRK